MSVMVLSILLAALYAAFTANLEAIQSARGSGRLNQRARVILDLMSRDLESAFATAPYTDPGDRLGIRLQDRSMLERPADGFDLTTLSAFQVPPAVPGSDLCEVGYYLEADPEGAGMILFRREDQTVDHDFTSGGEAWALSGGVSSLEILFVDEEGADHEQWQAERFLLPVLVKIRLVLFDESGREQIFSTSVHPALAGRARPW